MISNPSIAKHGFVVALALAFSWLVPSVSAEDYSEKVRPLLDQFCFDCHEGEDAEAEVDLDSFKSLDDLRMLLENLHSTRRMRFVVLTWGRAFGLES